MNEQQLRTLVPVIAGVLEGHDFETSVSALMSTLLQMIVNSPNLEDPVDFAQTMGDGLAVSVRCALAVKSGRALQ